MTGRARSQRRRAFRDERGDAMVVWCLGLALLFLPLGAISLEAWHALSDERALQSAASAAADAAASAINTTSYRQTGRLTLDPVTAAQLADADLAQQPDLPTLTSAPTIAVNAQDTQVTVELHAQVHLTVLGLLAGGHPIHLTATGSAAPRGSGA